MSSAFVCGITTILTCTPAALERGIANRYRINGALPDAQQQLREFIEVPRTKFGPPFSLDITEDIENLCIGSLPALAKPHNSRTSLVRLIGPGDITEVLGD